MKDALAYRRAVEPAVAALAAGVRSQADVRRLAHINAAAAAAETDVEFMQGMIGHHAQAQAGRAAAIGHRLAHVDELDPADSAVRRQMPLDPAVESVGASDADPLGRALAAERDVAAPVIHHVLVNLVRDRPQVMVFEAVSISRILSSRRIETTTSP